jgi:hypothetical protein
MIFDMYIYDMIFDMYIYYMIFDMNMIWYLICTLYIWYVYDMIFDMPAVRARPIQNARTRVAHLTGRNSRLISSEMLRKCHFYYRSLSDNGEIYKSRNLSFTTCIYIRVARFFSVQTYQNGGNYTKLLPQTI